MSALQVGFLKGEIERRDAKIESNAKVIVALREALGEIERLGWKEGLGAEHAIASHYAIRKVARDAMTAYEQNIGERK